MDSGDDNDLDALIALCDDEDNDSDGASAGDAECEAEREPPSQIRDAADFSGLAASSSGLASSSSLAGSAAPASSVSRPKTLCSRLRPFRVRAGQGRYVARAAAPAALSSGGGIGPAPTASRPGAQSPAHWRCLPTADWRGTDARFDIDSPNLSTASFKCVMLETPPCVILLKSDVQPPDVIGASSRASAFIPALACHAS